MDIVKSHELPRWRRHRLHWIGLGIALTGAVIGLTLGVGKAAPTATRSDLWTDIVVRGDMRREIRATGTLVPRQLRWITAGASATVQDLEVLAGARVGADTVILRLANPELQANLQKAQAALAAAEADANAGKANLASQLLDQQAQEESASADWRIAQAKRDASERAHQAGVMSAIELKQAQITAEQDQLKARIESQRVAAFRQNMAAQRQAAQARREEAASAVEIARRQVQSMEVRAGIDGILQQVEVEPGQRVDIGAKLARVARPDELIARLQVPEVLAKDLVLDLPVSVDTRNGIAKGHLTRIDPAVRDGSVTVDVAFDAALPNGVRPDLSVEGQVLLGTVQDTLSIPRPPLAAPGMQGSLFVIPAGESQAQRRSVEYGAASSDRIQVRRGLRAGETVVLSDTSRWNGYDTLGIR